MKLFERGHIAQYAEDFRQNGFVHIPQAITEEFHADLLSESKNAKALTEFAIATRLSISELTHLKAGPFSTVLVMS